jgi:hypothetical protein
MSLLLRNIKVNVTYGTKSSIITEQSGSALILAMLMLMMLSLIGIAATTTSTIEMGIAANERAYKDNLNRAEAAALIGVQVVENEKDDAPLKDLPQTKYKTWLHFNLPDTNTLKGPNNWLPTNSAQAIDSESKYLGDYKRVAPGASLDMSEPTVHEFSIYGQSERNRGSVIIEIGYRKRY